MMVKPEQIKVGLLVTFVGAELTGDSFKYILNEKSIIVYGVLVDGDFLNIKTGEVYPFFELDKEGRSKTDINLYQPYIYRAIENIEDYNRDVENIANYMPHENTADRYLIDSRLKGDELDKYLRMAESALENYQSKKELENVGKVVDFRKWKEKRINS